ncbi:MAG: glycosyltransferase [Oscillospiraceae bacterium]|nr:glycosyltransferase [Oscillospiraceae bacterium]
MDRLPLISVIVPAYNSEKWLKDCCYSVFCQSYPNVELIIVDDGSTDGTLALATKLADGKEHVKVIHTENGGVCRARNNGLDAAVGSYITFLDADDVLMSDALEVLYSGMIREDADISIGWKSNMTANGADLGCPYERISGVFCGTEALRLSLEDHPAMYAVWGKLYKRDAIGDVRFVEGRRVHEDSFFVFQCLLKQPKVVIGDEIVLRYRISENSASRSGFSDKFFDIIAFAERKKVLVGENYPEYLPLAENVIVKANMALLKNLVKTKAPQYRDCEKKAINEILTRKAYYKTAIKSDARWFWILTHRLYGLYKMLYMVKNKM